MRCALRVFALLLFCCPVAAQVTFSKIPQSLQLFPRDSSNFGYFEITGISQKSGMVRTVIIELLTGKAIESFSQQVVPSVDFHFQHKIPACLKEYNLEVFFKGDSAEKRVKLVTNLVAGDFFIVDGQSNAECPSVENFQKHDSTYFSPFNRVIGGNFSWLTRLAGDSLHPLYNISEDCKFLRPSSNYYYYDDFGYSGIWPVRLQYELAKATGIPNCVVNGAVGGTGIADHFASHTPSKPDSLLYDRGPHNHPPASIYDRIYKKLLSGNAIAGVKAIFFYQGESDGNIPYDSSSKYADRFHTLYTSWKADYPSLKKIFVIQINLGCGGEYHNLVREAQRKFPERYPDVAVLSTVGSPLSDRAPDLCHYTIQGYSHIAAKLAPMAQKYLYAQPLDEELILPANIKKAYYTAHDKICLEFDKDVIVQDSCGYSSGWVYMKDYFFDQADQPLPLKKVEAVKNKVFLNMTENKPDVTSIIYLPKIFSHAPSLYSGPWILNEKNQDLGAYAFSYFPVQPFQYRKDPIIYPNPAQNYVVLDFSKEEPHEIRMYDLFGKLVLKTTSYISLAVIDIQHLQSGLYILSVDVNGGTVKSKLLVERH